MGVALAAKNVPVFPVIPIPVQLRYGQSRVLRVRK